MNRVSFRQVPTCVLGIIRRTGGSSSRPFRRSGPVGFPASPRVLLLTSGFRRTGRY